MRREEVFAFVDDGVRLELEEPVDFAALLRALGFRSVVMPCPRCGRDGEVRVVRGLLVSADAYGHEDVSCVELTAGDFTKSAGQWQLAALAMVALMQH